MPRQGGILAVFYPSNGISPRFCSNKAVAFITAAFFCAVLYGAFFPRLYLRIFQYHYPKSDADKGDVLEKFLFHNGEPLCLLLTSKTLRAGLLPCLKQS